MNYDKYHFISKPSLERHLEKISCVSMLWGLNVSALNEACVLELGCGAGDNLIPMALSYQDSYFVGVDISHSQVKKGNENIKKLGLKNIILIEKDFSKFALSDIKFEDKKKKIKEFDYIIMHGVFSWVSDKARRSALKIIKKYLSLNGVSYISFNSYPGCVFRDLLIKLLRKNDDSKKSLEDRVKNIRERLSFLEECLQDGSSFYSLGLKNEVMNVINLSDSFIVNEILNDEYRSFTLESFIKEIKKYGLYYLSDASYIRGFSESRKEENLKQNFEAYESYIDFIFPKITRGVLATHLNKGKNKEENKEKDKEKDKEKNKIGNFERKINLDAMDDFYVSSPLVYDGGTNNFAEFKLPNSQTFEFENSAEIDFFKKLESAWPKPIKLRDIECIVRKRKVLDYFSKEFVNFFTTDLCFKNVLDEAPRVSSFAKIQLETQDFATNYRNEYVIFNDFQKKVFNLLDGKNTKRDILNILIDDLKEQGKYSIDIYRELDEELQKTLEFFLETAYLK